MRNTFCVKYYVRKSKCNKNGEAPLEMSISINGSRHFLNLPYRTTPEEFNKKRKSKELLNYMEIMRTRINQILVDMSMHGEPLTTERLLAYIRTGGYKSYTINDLFNDYLDILRKRVGINLTQSVYRKYELVRDLFFKHIDPTKECTDITQNVIMAFYATLNGKYDTSTAAGYMTKLKTFITFGMDNAKIKINPFQNIRVNKGIKPIVTLKESEISIIENAHLENESLQRVLDCFVFELNSGISYADMMLLTKDDIKEDNGTYYVHKRRKKTGTEYTAIILPKGMEVLRKYDYKLPVISNQKTNLYLSRIRELLNIDTHITTHIARHSFGQRLLSAGVRLETISHILGHKSVKVTERFYCSITTQDAIKEVATSFS